MADDNKDSAVARRVLIASSDTELAAEIPAMMDPGSRNRFLCRHADSLAAVLQILSKEPFDAILLDLQLNGGSGLEIMQAVQGKTHAPIVILTQAGDEATSLQCLGQGAQEYLPKEDLDSGSLRRALGYAISRHRANDLRLRLEHSDKLASLGQLTAGVAHEINNPATYVLGNLHQIQEVMHRLKSGDGASGDLELVAEMAADCCRGVELIANISRELTLFARNDDATMELVDIEELIKNTSAMTLNEIRYRAKFEKRVVGAPNVIGNRSRLSQVLVNLLINAAHSIDEGTSADNQITISAEVDAGEVVIRVQDTGCGISAAALEHIFEAYYTTKAQGMGTGLGLPICKEIVLLHKGTLDVQSQVGVGTTFTLRLPASGGVAEATKPRTPTRNLPDRAEKPRQRILLIDDEPLLLKSLARTLKAHHEVVTAIGGQNALDTLGADGGFDIIICDLMMPEIDGIKIYESLQTDYPHLIGRLIFLSGGVFTSRMSSFVKDLDVPLLDKPVRRDDLLAAIDALAMDSSSPK